MSVACGLSSRTESTLLETVTKRFLKNIERLQATRRVDVKIIFFSVVVNSLGTEEPKNEAEKKIFYERRKRIFRAAQRAIRVWQFQLSGA